MHDHDDHGEVRHRSPLLDAEDRRKEHHGPSGDVDAVREVRPPVPVGKDLHPTAEPDQTVGEGVLADDEPSTAPPAQRGQNEHPDPEPIIERDLVDEELDQCAEGERGGELQNLRVAEQLERRRQVADMQSLQHAERENQHREGRTHDAPGQGAHDAERQDPQVAAELPHQGPCGAVPGVVPLQHRVNAGARAGDRPLSEDQGEVARHVIPRGIRCDGEEAANGPALVPPRQGREHECRDDEDEEPGREDADDAMPQEAHRGGAVHHAAGDEHSRQEEEARDGHSAQRRLRAPLGADIHAAEETGDGSRVREDDHEGHQPAKKADGVVTGVEGDSETRQSALTIRRDSRTCRRPPRSPGGGWSQQGAARRSRRPPRRRRRSDRCRSPS